MLREWFHALVLAQQSVCDKQALEADVVMAMDNVVVDDMLMGHELAGVDRAGVDIFACHGHVVYLLFYHDGGGYDDGHGWDEDAMGVSDVGGDDGDVGAGADGDGGGLIYPLIYYWAP
jgi:hypothetical protein